MTGSALRLVALPLLLAARKQRERLLELAAFAMDQRDVEQRGSRGLAGGQRLLLGRDRERLVPAAEQDELDQSAGAQVGLPAAVAASAGKWDRPVHELDGFGEAIGCLEHDAEVVLGPQRADIQLLGVRPFGRGLEQDSRLNQPPAVVERKGLAGQRLDEDFGQEQPLGEGERALERSFY